jgi:hypothetical protein
VAFLWRRLGFEQKVAAVASVLLIVSTFGPFSMVEAAMVLTCLGVLALLRARAQRRQFHLPFGDGTVILAAAGWYALLIVTRVFDRPLGQSALALACCAVLAAAGLRERARRPADDVAAPPPPRPAPAASPSPSEELTVPLRRDQERTAVLDSDDDPGGPTSGPPRPPRPDDPPRPR